MSADRARLLTSCYVLTLRGDVLTVGGTRRLCTKIGERLMLIHLGVVDGYRMDEEEKVQTRWDEASSVYFHYAKLMMGSLWLCCDTYCYLATAIMPLSIVLRGRHGLDLGVLSISCYMTAWTVKPNEIECFKHFCTTSHLK